MGLGFRLGFFGALFTFVGIWNLVVRILYGENESPKSLATATARGVDSAQADIKRGVFRILDYGEPLPPGAGRRVDPQTRYPLEPIWGCVVTERFTTEVEGCNNTMRAWHAKHKQ